MILLAGCSSGSRDDRAPPPRPTAGAPVTVPIPDRRETEACFADLRRADVRFTPLPDQNFGTGCSAIGSVTLLDIGVPVTNLKSMRCGLARSFVGWVRFGVAPAARQILGSDLVKIESFGSYACRNVIGNAYSAAIRSGHAISNAVDIAAFVLADGRRITVEKGWRSPDRRERDFLKTIHNSACKRFGTVLSPDYNAAHHNHIHLEDDRAGFCR
ncbi:MAG: extensin [Sphingomonas sp. 28-66-16]|nr:MAG: extensin [Sphingomonas sp. 28-66-16]